MSDLWEIALPEELRVGDIVAKHCAETPQSIVTIEKKVVNGFAGSYVVNDNHNRPLLNWMPVYRRIRLNKRRLAATMAKMLVDAGEEQVAGVLVQMFGSGEPYEVEGDSTDV